ncbi:MAG: hypothetical protein IKU52_03575 [Clostridia bacterium]|nr:hypothetical protein [Clostridia bacterium]
MKTRMALLKDKKYNDLIAICTDTDYVDMLFKSIALMHKGEFNACADAFVVAVDEMQSVETLMELVEIEFFDFCEEMCKVGTEKVVDNLLNYEMNNDPTALMKIPDTVAAVRDSLNKIVAACNKFDITGLNQYNLSLLTFTTMNGEVATEILKFVERYYEKFAVEYVNMLKVDESMDATVAVMQLLTNTKKTMEQGNYIKALIGFVDIFLSTLKNDTEYGLEKKKELYPRLITAQRKLIETSAPGNPKKIYLYSLGTTARRDMINTLSSYIMKYKMIDPTYQPEPLPVAGEVSQPQKTTQPTTTSSGGCYVATAVYGSYDCPEVWTLRRFRDSTLAKTIMGRVFIHTYYAISPTIVKLFGENKWFKAMWRKPLDKMVAKLNANGTENTPYNDINW